MKRDTERPTTAIFQSSLFTLSWPEEVDPVEAPPLGKDFADYLVTQMQQVNIQAEIHGPFEDESSWTVLVLFSDEDYILSAVYIPPGMSQTDEPLSQTDEPYWSVQIEEDRSLLRSIQWWRPRSVHFQQVRHIVDKILRNMSDIRDLRWLTDAELYKFYDRRGM